MPADPPYTLLWHVTLHYTLHSQRCQNGFYFSNQNSLNERIPPDLSWAQVLGTHFANFMVPTIANFMNQQVVFTGLVVSTLIPHEGPVIEIPFLTLNGSQGDESLPSYCAAVISLRTGLAGKTNRGRLYLAGVSEDHQLNSELSPDLFASLSDIGNQLVTLYGISGSQGDMRHIIFSKKVGYSGGVWNKIGIRPIREYVPRRVLGTQRHRMLGHGS